MIRRPDLDAVIADYIGTISASDASDVLSAALAAHPEWCGIVVRRPLRTPTRRNRKWTDVWALGRGARLHWFAPAPTTDPRSLTGPWGGLGRNGAGIVRSVLVHDDNGALLGHILRVPHGRRNHRFLAYRGRGGYTEGPLPQPVGARAFSSVLAAERILGAS